MAVVSIVLHVKVYFYNTGRRKKNAFFFLNLHTISFFGVTSNQKSTFENLVQSTI